MMLLLSVVNKEYTPWLCKHNHLGLLVTDLRKGNFSKAVMALNSRNVHEVWGRGFCREREED